MIKNLKTFTAGILIYIFLIIKDAQATGEAFSPHKRISSTSKHKNSFLFSNLWVIFAPLDPFPDPATQIMQIHPDPDPQPCH
jgi:hypothetical protein